MMYCTCCQSRLVFGLGLGIEYLPLCYDGVDVLGAEDIVVAFVGDLAFQLLD